MTQSGRFHCIFIVTLKCEDRTSYLLSRLATIISQHWSLEFIDRRDFVVLEHMELVFKQNFNKVCPCLALHQPSCTLLLIKNVNSGCGNTGKEAPALTNQHHLKALARHIVVDSIVGVHLLQCCQVSRPDSTTPSILLCGLCNSYLTVILIMMLATWVYICMGQSTHYSLALQALL